MATSEVAKVGVANVEVVKAKVVEVEVAIGEKVMMDAPKDLISKKGP